MGCAEKVCGMGRVEDGVINGNEWRCEDVRKCGCIN